MAHIAIRTIPGTDIAENQEGCCSGMEALGHIRAFRLTTNRVQSVSLNDCFDPVIFRRIGNPDFQPFRFA